MTRVVTTALTVAVLTFATGTAFAAEGSMSSSKMSTSDTAMMKKCQAMSETAMKENKECMAMMKAHPDMMKSGSSGSMKSGGMSK